MVKEYKGLKTGDQENDIDFCPTYVCRAKTNLIRAYKPLFANAKETICWASFSISARCASPKKLSI